LPTPTPAIPTFASDVMVTALTLNAVGSNLTNLYNYTMGGFRTLKPLCVLRVAGTVSIPSSTDRVIAWDTADVNYDSMWSSGSPTFMTVNTAGVYRLSVQPAHANSAGGIWQLAGYVLINGTAVATNAVAGFNIDGYMGTCSALVGLSVGNTIYGSIFQATGLSQNLRTTDGGCRMVAEWVSP